MYKMIKKNQAQNNRIREKLGKIIIGIDYSRKRLPTNEKKKKKKIKEKKNET